MQYTLSIWVNGGYIGKLFYETKEIMTSRKIEFSMVFDNIPTINNYAIFEGFQ